MSPEDMIIEGLAMAIEEFALMFRAGEASEEDLQDLLDSVPEHARFVTEVYEGEGLKFS